MPRHVRPVAELVVARHPQRAQALVLLTPVPLTGAHLACWNTGDPEGRTRSPYLGPTLIATGTEDSFAPYCPDRTTGQATTTWLCSPKPLDIDTK